MYNLLYRLPIIFTGFNVIFEVCYESFQHFALSLFTLCNIGNEFRILLTYTWMKQHPTYTLISFPLLPEASEDCPPGVSLKQALADQGITGKGRSMTERDLWVQKEKEFLAAIMLENGIEWEQKGEHKEHLSVLEFKREKRKEELAELEQSIERVQQQQVSIKAVEQMEAKPLPLTSKVAVEREDYQTLV